MKKSILSLCAALTFGVISLSGSVTAQQPMDECGMLVNVNFCIFFQSDSGGLYLLDNWGTGAIGEPIRATGIFDPFCVPTICPVYDGFIVNTVITECGVGTNYCTSNPTSAGAASTLSGSGSASLSTNSFEVSADAVPAGQPGIFFYGPNQIQAVFGDGFRCVGGSTHRLLPPSMADAGGVLSRVIDFTAAPAAIGPGEITAGSSWNIQAWFRDPEGSSGFNLSDGLSVTFTP